MPHYSSRQNPLWQTNISEITEMANKGPLCWFCIWTLLSHCVFLHLNFKESFILSFTVVCVWVHRCIKVKISFTYHCPGVLAPQYDRGLTGSVLSTATQWGPGRTGQIEVVKKELCSHVTGSCFALRPGIPVDPLRSHMNTMTKPAAEPGPDLLTAINIHLTWPLKTCLTDLIESKEMSQTHSIEVWTVFIISVPFNALQLMQFSILLLHFTYLQISWKETSQHTVTKWIPWVFFHVEFSCHGNTEGSLCWVISKWQKKSFRNFWI